jgi:hypothetical protein
MSTKRMMVRIFVLSAMAVFVLQGLFSCQPAAPKADKFIGLQLYSLREAMKTDVIGTVAKVGEMGYKFVETAGYGDGKFYEWIRLLSKNFAKPMGCNFWVRTPGRTFPTRQTGKPPWPGGMPVLMRILPPE